MDKIGFDYDYHPNLALAGKFDLFVTDPDGTAHRSWSDAKEAGAKFLAYLSWYEIGPGDPYIFTEQKLLKVAKARGIKVLADNPRWKSKIMDTANPEWQDLFMELVGDAAGKGYDGIYFDTWDGYGDAKQKAPKREKLMASNVAILKRIRAEHPQLQLMLNRGWEVMRPCAPFADRLLVESVWHSHDGEVSGTADMLKRIEKAKALGYEVNILDYVPSGDQDLAIEICSKARAIDCGCTVVQSSLTSPKILAVA